MKLHIRNGRVVDPASGRDAVGDVFVVDGKISAEGGKADKVIDAKGLVVSPGFIDLSARRKRPASGCSNQRTPGTSATWQPVPRLAR